jgi:DNA-binding MarR family transcriptional regulator
MQAPKSQTTLKQLPQLFFEMKQLIRTKLPHTHDPNEWMRCEILRYIDSKETPTMRNVAEYLHIKAPSVTSIVIRLEREGLVARIKEKNDRRVVRISLTKKGVARMHKYVSESSQAMEKVFSKMRSKDVEELARILRSLQEAHKSPRT